MNCVCFSLLRSTRSLQPHPGLKRSTAQDFQNFSFCHATTWGGNTLTGNLSTSELTWVIICQLAQTFNPCPICYMAVLRESKSLPSKIYPEWISGQIMLWISFFWAGSVLLGANLTTDRQAARGHPRDWSPISYPPLPLVLTANGRTAQHSPIKWTTGRVYSRHFM